MCILLNVYDCEYFKKDMQVISTLLVDCTWIFYSVILKCITGKVAMLFVVWSDANTS